MKSAIILSLAAALTFGGGAKASTIAFEKLNPDIKGVKIEVKLKELEPGGRLNPIPVPKDPTIKTK